MKGTRIMMDMPITIEVVDADSSSDIITQVFAFFTYVDNKFSTFKDNSEISQINRGEIKPADYSQDMKEIFALAEKTKLETAGFYDTFHNGKIDPSGVVKGWAIFKAAEIIKNRGYQNYFVDAGGDIQVGGLNDQGNNWVIGIRNPFNRDQNVKIVQVSSEGVATSGTYIRGQHIYNPHQPNHPITDIVSLTVIGPNILEADRFATPAFAMGKEGINFIENLAGFEGYMIDKSGLATYTSNWNNYVVKD